ncbi:HAD domain-containing protein [Collimonas fungivorans]|uniref:HAD domain-containing protein n=1 Tax=Collimonas fungivorans TaxID=158899 RepID=UPI001237421A|nr:HAD domain-containing protein [Collimonas fungivorans]
MILFLDFDGVLHPDAVFLIGGHPILARGGKTFMWAQPLVDLLSLYPEISIVLSTPWVEHIGFSRTKAVLPEPLRKRVIGSTWHFAMMPNSGGVLSDCEDWYDTATRYEKIARSLKRTNLSSRDWVAIEHNIQAWPQEMLHHLVKVDRKKGLSCQVFLAELKARLVENYLAHTSRGTNINFRAPVQLETNIEA